MAYYSIGEVAERCGINPVTLRAWQRRYGLLKPQRSEGGHRQFDEEDVQRIEEIKRWIDRGVSVGKVKALLEGHQPETQDAAILLQEEMMTLLRGVQPSKLRTRIMSLSHEYPVDKLIDRLFVPVRSKLNLDPNTSMAIISMLDGILIDCVASILAESRKKVGKETLLVGWGNEDRTRLWPFIAARLARQRAGGAAGFSSPGTVSWSAHFCLDRPRADPLAGRIT